jgi:hypothetical protein
MRSIALALFTIFLVSGCKSELSDPETIDPIYKSLSAELEESRKAIDAAKKALEGAKKEMSMAVPQTGENKVRIGQFFDAERKVDELLQQKRFLEVHLKSRKEFARKSYKIAFSKDIPWPDPEEWAAYQVNRKLAGDPRSWDERLRKYFAERAPAAKKEEKKPEGGGH